MGDGLEQLGLAHAETVAQGDRLPQQSDLGGEQRVVGQLHGLPRAERPDVQDRVAVGGEHRPDTCDGVIGTADEQCERTGGNVVRSTADRRIEDVDVGEWAATVWTVRGLPVV